MNNRLLSVLLSAMVFALTGQPAKAQAPREINTGKNKAVALTNLVNAPNNCGSNPGPVPLPKLLEKPSHGSVGLQVATTDVPATDACPARKIPSVALFYAPNKDFVGKDSVQVELTFDAKILAASFLITVQEVDEK
jgi:hypothetical protein